MLNFQIFIFFLPSVTDRNKEINKYFNNVSIFPTDVSQEQLNNRAGVEFNPSKLDLFGRDKALMSAAVVKCLRHINDISNSNLARNAEAYCLGKKLKCLLTRLENLRSV